jgi:fructose-bisphosphate aldolase class II
MPVVSREEIVDRAFASRCGVPAVNVFNDLTMQGVLDRLDDEIEAMLVASAEIATRVCRPAKLVSAHRSILTGEF